MSAPRLGMLPGSARTRDLAPGERSCTVSAGKRRTPAFRPGPHDHSHRGRGRIPAEPLLRCRISMRLASIRVNPFFPGRPRDTRKDESRRPGRNIASSTPGARTVSPESARPHEGNPAIVRRQPCDLLVILKSSLAGRLPTSYQNQNAVFSLSERVRLPCTNVQWFPFVSSALVSRKFLSAIT